MNLNIISTLNLKSSKISLFLLVSSVIFAKVTCAPAEVSQWNDVDDVCGHTFQRQPTFFKRHFDMSFVKKFFKHWVPFTNAERQKMSFFLYKRDFPECGREILIDDDESLARSGFNADHPTRFVIHGWMSQSIGKFNRAVKNAYMTLAKAENFTDNTSDENNFTGGNETYEVPLAPFNDKDDGVRGKRGTKSNQVDDANKNTIDFNIILVDWSAISSNVNYFGVVEMIDDLGFRLAEFLRYLNLKAHMHFDDVYLIGHSLGAQMAGSAGKHIYPYRINTIYALDPAGPKFRNASDDKRLDPSDAEYVESIQTSSSLGFEDPVGHATFYPNFGKDQEKCYKFGCSHSRSHKYFAESITSERGFWGTLCQRQSEKVWVLSTSGVQFKMGGEPSTPKRGTFYVRTNAMPPFAMGRRTLEEVMDEFRGNNRIVLENLM